MQNKTLFSVGDILQGIWKRKKELSEVSIIGYAILTVTFLLQVAIARLLGTEGFGVYSVTLAMVALVEVPLVVRGSEIAMRTLGERWQKGDIYEFKALAREMIRYDCRLYLLVFLFLSVAALILQYASGVEPWIFIILALMIPAQAGFGVFKSYFIIFSKVTEMVRYEFIYVISLACMNLIGLLIWGVYGLAVSMVMAMLAKTYLAYYYTQNYLPNTEFISSAPHQPPSLTREGLFSIVRNFFFNGLNQIDIVLLGLLQKPEIVALYKVGKSLASLPTKVSYPVWRYLQPRLLEAIQKGDKQKEKRLILAGAAVLVVVMLCLTPLVLFFGESALVFLYGEAYKDAFEFFLILVIGIWAFHGVTGWFKFWVVVTDSRWYGIGVYAAAFIATIIFGVVFGAATPVAMSYVVTFVMITMSIVAFVKVFRS